MFLPTQTIQAVLTSVAGQNVWVATMPADNTKRLLKRISLQGPAGSTVVFYIGSIFTDITFHGDINSNDYTNGIPIPAGQTMQAIWNTGAAMTSTIPNTPNVPTVSWFLTDEEW